MFSEIQSPMHMDRNKMRSEIAIYNRLKTFTLTQSLVQLEDSIKQFCKFDFNTTKNNVKDNGYLTDSQLELAEESNEYMEILKMRHVSLVA